MQNVQGRVGLLLLVCLCPGLGGHWLAGQFRLRQMGIWLNRLSYVIGRTSKNTKFSRPMQEIRRSPAPSHGPPCKGPYLEGTREGTTLVTGVHRRRGTKLHVSSGTSWTSWKEDKADNGFVSDAKYELNWILSSHSRRSSLLLFVYQAMANSNRTSLVIFCLLHSLFWPTSACKISYTTTIK